MPLREDLLTPIPGANPAGEDLRYTPLYDKLKEARLQEEELPLGAWQRERKVADYPLVIKLTQEAIATKSKDLQLAAWLTEALLNTSGFAGLRDGLGLCRGLLENFWDTVYPPLEDGDAEMRAAPLSWIGTTLDDAAKKVPLVRDGYGWYKFGESRKVGFEDQAKTDQEKKNREKTLKEGKLAPEVFDKSFTETPKALYLQGEKDLDACLESLKVLDEFCKEKFGDAAPSLSKLRDGLAEVRHTVHTLLQKKRETEPDPVEEVPPEAAAAGQEGGAAAEGAGGTTTAAGLVVSVLTSSEPEDRKEAIASISAAAAFLRRREPYSPAAYLMMRGLRWGELRAAAELSDPTMLEAPPTEVRQHIKRLAVNKKWKELLEAGENVMALPYSRAWLDLQRLVVEACVALGSEYNAIAVAIRSELKALLRDVPQLLPATLMDDTPAANAETQGWLRELLQEPADAAPTTKPAAPVTEDGTAPGWQKKFIDSYSLATEALRAGQEQKAFEIMRQEVERQRSGRGRFQRKLQLVQLCLATGKDTIAQPLLDDLAATIEAHKLDEWEDREMVAAALAAIMKSSKKIQGDAKEKQKLFERICRLDPVQALTV